MPGPSARGRCVGKTAPISRWKVDHTHTDYINVACFQDAKLLTDSWREAITALLGRTLRSPTTFICLTEYRSEDRCRLLSIITTIRPDCLPIFFKSVQPRIFLSIAVLGASGLC